MCSASWGLSEHRWNFTSRPDLCTDARARQWLSLKYIPTSWRSWSDGLPSRNCDRKGPTATQSCILSLTQLLFVIARQNTVRPSIERLETSPRSKSVKVCCWSFFNVRPATDGRPGQPLLRSLTKIRSVVSIVRISSSVIHIILGLASPEAKAHKSAQSQL